MGALAISELNADRTLAEQPTNRATKQPNKRTSRVLCYKCFHELNRGPHSQTHSQPHPTAPSALMKKQTIKLAKRPQDEMRISHQTIRHRTSSNHQHQKSTSNAKN